MECSTREMVSLCDRLWVSVRLACDRLHLAISHSMCELFFFYSFSYVLYAWWTRVVSSDLSVPMGFHVIFAKTFNKYLNIMCLFPTHPTPNLNPTSPSSTLSTLQWLELQWILCAWLLCIIIAYVKLLRFRHFHRWCSDVVWSRVEVSIGPFFPTFSGPSQNRMFQIIAENSVRGVLTENFLKFGARVIFGAFEPKCSDTKFHVSLGSSEKCPRNPDWDLWSREREREFVVVGFLVSRLATTTMIHRSDIVTIIVFVMHENCHSTSVQPAILSTCEI